MIIYNENDGEYKIRISEPISKKKLIAITLKVKELLNFDLNDFYVDIVFCLEFLLPYLDNDFIYCVPDKWFKSNNNEAFYDPIKNCIYVRADVYDKAIDGDGRARFTIAHEIAHYFLFRLFGIPYFIDIEEIIKYSDATLKSMDPEWQANIFANTFLCTPNIIKNLSVDEISEKCGVTENAAYIAWKNANNLSYKDIDFGSKSTINRIRRKIS